MLRIKSSAEGNAGEHLFRRKVKRSISNTIPCDSDYGTLCSYAYLSHVRIRGTAAATSELALESQEAEVTKEFRDRARTHSPIRNPQPRDLLQTTPSCWATGTTRTTGAIEKAKELVRMRVERQVIIYIRVERKGCATD